MIEQAFALHEDVHLCLLHMLEEASSKQKPGKKLLQTRAEGPHAGLNRAPLFQKSMNTSEAGSHCAIAAKGAKANMQSACPAEQHKSRNQHSLCHRQIHCALLLLQHLLLASSDAQVCKPMLLSATKRKIIPPSASSSTAQSHQMPHLQWALCAPQEACVGAGLYDALRGLWKTASADPVLLRDVLHVLENAVGDSVPAQLAFCSQVHWYSKTQAIRAC